MTFRDGTTVPMAKPVIPKPLYASPYGEGGPPSAGGGSMGSMPSRYSGGSTINSDQFNPFKLQGGSNPGRSMMREEGQRYFNQLGDPDETIPSSAGNPAAPPSPGPGSATSPSSASGPGPGVSTVAGGSKPAVKFGDLPGEVQDRLRASGVFDSLAADL